MRHSCCNHYQRTRSFESALRPSLPAQNYHDESDESQSKSTTISWILGAKSCTPTLVHIFASHDQSRPSASRAYAGTAAEPAEWSRAHLEARLRTTIIVIHQLEAGLSRRSYLGKPKNRSKDTLKRLRHWSEKGWRGVGGEDGIPRAKRGASKHVYRQGGLTEEYSARRQRCQERAS